MSAEPRAAPPALDAPGFTEKGFYLEEFHGKTVAVAAVAADLEPAATLTGVIEELTGNGTQVLVLSTARAVLEPLVGGRVLAMSTPRLEGAVWRALRAAAGTGAASLGLVLDDAGDFAATCRRVGIQLGLSKLVWMDPGGGLVRPDGRRESFVHLSDLRALLERPGGLEPSRIALLRELEAMLAGGVSAVNLCTLEGLGAELFTYDGSGTLFTPERYVGVRRLGIDDFDAASDLIARGTEEGFLAPRRGDQLDQILASGFGAFIDGYHLAGIGALLVGPEERCGEVASLYTLTRFLGEGVGAHLVGFACGRARELGLDFVYACTTSDRVAAFFERNGFYAVPHEALPRSKWEGYDPERQGRVSALRCDFGRPRASA